CSCQFPSCASCPSHSPAVQHRRRCSPARRSEWPIIVGLARRAGLANRESGRIASMSDHALTARRLLNHQSMGVLSTHSVDVEGYPFGSIVPYVLDYNGLPTLLISDIAQHTRNIKRNNKVSLTVFDQGADDPQASSRLTWIGDAESIPPPDTDARLRYLRVFPLLSILL